jgi:predicted small lipoprotein YifL
LRHIDDKITFCKFNGECAMPKLLFSLVLLGLTYAGLAGCGTKGPLYIPEQRYPQPVAKPAPAANTDAASQPASQTPIKE